MPNESGQTTAEYGVIFALVIVTAVITLFVFGTTVETMWTGIIDAWPG